MELTGKAKEVFEKWYIKTHFSKNIDEESIKYHKRNFNLSRLESEQWGVYQDFFDSVGIPIIINSYFDEGLNFHWYIEWFDKGTFHNATSCPELPDFKEREEARSSAIEKANEVYNTLYKP